MQRTATIANGASLSDIVDLGPEARLKAVQMPAAWTAAGMTFQVSNDGTNFFDLFSSAAEVAFTVVANQMIGLTYDQNSFFERFRYIKVRSGTTGAPVAQGAQRLVVLHADSSLGGIN